LLSDKVKKKYGNLQGNLVIASLERGQQGLGISLAGHKDRTKMAVFVCGLNPSGTASKDGTLKVGDEILEVGSFFISKLRYRPGGKLRPVCLQKGCSLDFWLCPESV
jgi:hypothetical protein